MIFERLIKKLLEIFIGDAITMFTFQAGGCCHTFIDKGYEFDVGIHYIGEMSKDKINRTLVDQITEGQVEWEKLDEEFDVVSIG